MTKPAEVTDPELNCADLVDRIEELQQQNRALTAATEELQEFVRLAARDLNEPLQKLRSFSSLMRDEYFERVDEVGRYYIERMHSSAERMSRVVGDVLEFAHIAPDHTQFQEVDMMRLMRRLTLAFELSLEEANGDIVQHDLPNVYGDARQIGRMMECLVDNAIRYRSPDRQLVIEVSGTTTDSGRTAVISIRDNGIGFDNQDREKIFLPFHRMDRKASDSGCGVGLAVARRIANHHGGGLVATSTPGAGSVFTVLLPAAVVPAA